MYSSLTIQPLPLPKLIIKKNEFKNIKNIMYIYKIYFIVIIFKK